TLVHPGGLAKQRRRRRGLGDKRERTILEDRDLDRNDLAPLVGGGVVVRLYEFHQVHAVRAERRAHGGSGRGLTGGKLHLDCGEKSPTSHLSCSWVSCW